MKIQKAFQELLGLVNTGTLFSTALELVNYRHKLTIEQKAEVHRLYLVR